jgi:lipopolysaccharide/colanic/teichoic acid biosynthesis glycosyltransferase
MAKRLADLVVASLALVVLGPVLLLAALAVRFSGPGPVLHRATRVGRGGRPFTMWKFRSMHVATDGGGGEASAITAHGDPRVFRAGQWLRKLKVDELPQLFNVLAGQMSIVGPRPEDPRIVREHYQPQHWETLEVRPGLASPGSIFNYTHAESMIGTADPEYDYVERVMPFKLALETVYVRHASLAYDVRVVYRTLRVILARASGRRDFPMPPESREAEAIVDSWQAATPVRRRGGSPTEIVPSA